MEHTAVGSYSIHKEVCILTHRKSYLVIMVILKNINICLNPYQAKSNIGNQLMHNINTHAFTALVLKPNDYKIIVTHISIELHLDEN